MRRMAGVLGCVSGMHVVFAAQLDALKRSAKDWIFNICDRLGAQRLKQGILNLRSFKILCVHTLFLHAKFNAEQSALAS